MADSEDELMIGKPPGGWGQGRAIRSFEDLRVWQYSQVLRGEVKQLARGLPSDEKFRLSDQLIRAARSVTNNIAQGYGRFTYKDNICFCRQSRGALYEFIDHLTICLDEDYITDEVFRHHKNRCLSAIRQLNGYIRFLHQQTAKTQS